MDVTKFLELGFLVYHIGLLVYHIIGSATDHKSLELTHTEAMNPVEKGLNH